MVFIINIFYYFQDKKRAAIGCRWKPDPQEH
jgi:hypothetical protein